MTENALEEELLAEDAEPKKKRRIPTWLIAGCSIGCIGTILLAAASAWALKSMMDPEQQWPKLRQALHFEERPESVDLVMGVPIPGVMSTWPLSDNEGRYVATVMVFHQGVSNAEREALFSPDGTEVPMGVLQPVDAVAGTHLVQEREVPTLSFSKVKGAAAVGGPTTRFDLSADGGKFRMVEMRFLRGGTTEDHLALADEFFAEFDVWHGFDDEDESAE